MKKCLMIFTGLALSILLVGCGSLDQNEPINAKSSNSHIEENLNSDDSKADNTDKNDIDLSDNSELNEEANGKIETDASTEDTELVDTKDEANADENSYSTIILEWDGKNEEGQLFRAILVEAIITLDEQEILLNKNEIDSYTVEYADSEGNIVVKSSTEMGSDIGQLFLEIYNDELSYSFHIEHDGTPDDDMFFAGVGNLNSSLSLESKNGDVIEYNSDDFKLRGATGYWYMQINYANGELQF